MKIYLDELSLNITATIVSVNIFDKKLQKRINELGFFNGEKIKVLNHSTLKKDLIGGVDAYNFCYQKKHSTLYFGDFMKKVIIIGNPNTGKTTLFNSLTKSNEHTGNWHGVTVNTFEKKLFLMAKNTYL